MTFAEVNATLSPVGAIQSIMSDEERLYIWECVKQFPNEEVLEVGTAYGGTAILMAHAGARVWSLDNWSCGKQDECADNVAKSGVRDRIKLVAADSLVAAPAFADKSMAVVLVDGDHTGERPYLDLTAYAPKVKVGGYLLIDDTQNGHPAIEYALWRWGREQLGFVCDRTCHDTEGQVKLQGFKRTF